MSDELSIQELEDQEWDVGGDRQSDITHEFMNGSEKQFRVQDPDPDAIMDFMSPTTGDMRRSEQLYQLVNAAVVAPEITMERWRDIRTADKILLADKIGEEIGINRVMGFPDGGLEAELEDLLSESPESGDSQ